MRAIKISRPGGPEVLRPSEVPEPVVAPEELLVQVRATALNRADLLQRRGDDPAPPGVPPDIPGLEFAGTVLNGGHRTSTFRDGDRVMGLLGGGGYAEQVAVHERMCLAIPPGLTWAEAAAVPEAFLTAHDALFRRGKLSAGEVLLIHAAGSGVGTAAIQLGRVAGAFVLGASRSAEKRKRLHEIGAHQTVDASDPANMIAEIRRSAPLGVDVVLDLVGAAALPGNLQVLRDHGRVVVVGLLGGARGELNLVTLLRKRLTISGSVLRSLPLEEKIALTREFSRRTLPLLAAGRVRPVVDCAFDLADAAHAHRFMERNANFGKIVLTVTSGEG